MNPVSSAFTLAYEVSPIIFTGGLVSFSPIGLPMVAITQALTDARSVNQTILSGGNIAQFNQPFHLEATARIYVMGI